MEECNNIARQQQNLAEELKQQLTNAKKDSSARKTQAYLLQRTQNADQLWEAIKENDSKLRKLGQTEHNYFTVKYFEQIKKIYDEYNQYLKTCKKAEESEPNEEKLRRKETVIQELLYVIHEIRQDLGKDKPVTRYEFLKNDVQKQWEPVQHLHNDILMTSAIDEEYLSGHHAIKKKFEKIIEEIEEKIRECKMANADTPLPVINIPTFGGNYEEWPTFYDLFRKVFHQNDKISNAQKLQHLKSHLRGDAQTIIRHLAATEGNYVTAWNLLQQRYQNNRLIVSKLVDKMYDFPTISNESAQKLKQLYDVINECIEGIKNLGFDTSSWDPMIGRIISRKWDAETNRLYEQTLANPHDVPTLKEIFEFTKRRFQSLETVSTERAISKHIEKYRCQVCRGDHSIWKCSQFMSQSSVDRMKTIRDKQLCTKCLNHHFKEKCGITSRCKICNLYHHTLLHQDRQYNSNHNGRQNSAQNANSRQNSFQTNMRQNENHNPSPRANNTRNPYYGTHHASDEMENTEQKEVLLATALIQGQTINGTPQLLRVLIDQGSQSSFITEDAAQMLALPRQKIRAEIAGVGDSETKISKCMVTAQLKPRFPSNYTLTADLLVLPKITKALPSKPVPEISLDQWQNTILADPTFNTTGPIDILLGAEEHGKIILEGLKKNAGLIGQHTEFGWIISGQITTRESKQMQVRSLVSRIEEDNQLRKFWEIEEISDVQQMRPADRICEKFYKETTVRNENGSYTVKLPLKEKTPQLGESKSRAVARFLQLESKFKANPNLYNQYAEFMKEYLDLGHMEKIPAYANNQGKYYIPHQAVLREDSTTTKLRVVFDASCKTNNKQSLNEVMYAGPRLQNDLSDILLHWRRHRVAFIADIEKMYRQIRIDNEDQEYQRIIWRFHPNQPLQEYKLATVTYGTAAAPFLAIKTLHQLATDEENKFKKASRILLEDFYVDDALSGANSVGEAIQIQKDLVNLLKSGGFTLRKWASNSKEFLQQIPEELKEKNTVEIGEEETKKSLGILWNPSEDTFQFKVNRSSKICNTKRQMLSEIAKIFDPLGWLAPFIVRAKLMIQDLWLQKLAWDDPVNKETLERWVQFQEESKSISKIRIPRWIQQENEKIELLGFCDASEKAYGAVIYSRVESSGHITLLQAKSKVAPARNKTTLPKLELCAAVLLAKLMDKTVKALKINDPITYAWTDSMITLGWIKGDPIRWNTFVANRVSEITKYIPPEQWNHVRSSDNPADAVSRGVEISMLQESTFWWKGPNWLPNKENWPKKKEIPETDQAVKRAKCHQTCIAIQYQEWNRFSSLTRMIRVLTYCRRMRRNTTKGNLLPEELEETQKVIIRCVQEIEFKEEKSQLIQRKSVSKKSKIQNLNPFIDQEGLIRVGGRLKNADTPYNQKHPLILPRNCHLTTLILRDAHDKTLHGGNQLMLAYIRQKFWIVNAKRAIATMINNCIKCIRYKQQTAQQLMGDLPKERVTPSAPFSHTGIDYAGPIHVRTTKGRGQKSHKGYIAIFVCLATKAIHIEIVSDMTTETFIAAYRRFISRRGQCTNIYSDNGTTFVGAANQMKEEIREITQSNTVQDTISTAGTKWHFIPPSSPHFGGLWESGVKSMKHHLRRVIGETKLTYEEITTLACQIEACLNSRPLCVLSDVSDEESILTPGHFLIGKPIISAPTLAESEVKNSNLSQRWKLIQKIKKDFWKAWSTEYLNTLQMRYKWKEVKDNVKIGTIVLIKEDNINPANWPLARVTKTHPSDNGLVRVVTLQKGKTELKRAITKLIPLPCTNESNQPQQSPHKIEEKGTSPKEPLNVQTGGSFKPKFSLVNAIFCAMLVLGIPTSAKGNYTIQHPEKGLYIEHLGSSRIQIGDFRLQLQFNITKMSEDTRKVTQVIENFEKLCEEAKKLSTETQCNSLSHHLRQKESEMQLAKNGLPSLHRKRRGIFGQFLTSVFGVNDEAYRDIDSLQENQDELIRASKHQTKLMISAMSTVNDTEIKIENQLRKFQEKLNKGLSAINDMQTWYKSADINALNIHIISSYQLASNYIADVIGYYSKVFEIVYEKASIYKLLSPFHVTSIIKKANQKLPSSLKIWHIPRKTTAEETEGQWIKIYAYFTIEDISEFTLLKAIPTALQIKNGTYWEMDITNDILAIDYNNQQYFQLTHNEMKSCIQRKTTYLCSPPAVKNMETSPNCIIDDIYQRHQNKKCKIRRCTITGINWIQLYTPNSWMYITSKPTNIAITCNGNRQEVLLNTTGIIQMTEDCIIQTKQKIIRPKRLDTVPVVSSYSKASAFDIDLTTNTLHELNPSVSSFEEEPMFTIQGDLTRLKVGEQQLGQRLENTVWKKVKYHSYVTSSTTVLVAAIISIIGWVIYYAKRRSRRSQSTATPTHPSDEEMFELTPLQEFSRVHNSERGEHV